MKYYLAPLEGITNLYYRRLHNKYYKGIDKYYIPFINPFSGRLTNKDAREIDPSNNQLTNTKVVPQIISKDADDTIWLINELEKLGYDEVNFNFGCPSGTVVSKGRGSGILKDLVHLDNYLNEVFSNIKNVKISIKCRLGVQDENEFDKIIEIFNKYPLYELIIHPRTAKEGYKGDIHFDKFKEILSKTNFDIIYNGEIKSLEDIEYIKNNFPTVKGIMIGRGLIAKPDLVDETIINEDRLTTLKKFFNEVSEDFLNQYGWNNTKFYVKEMWVHLINYFDVPKNLKKELFKANKKDEFFEAVEKIYSTCPINEK